MAATNVAERRQADYPEPAKAHDAFNVYKIHDHGFVRLVDAMPSPTDAEAPTADAAIVQAARVSYGSGTKTVREDAGLIDYLMRHRHTTPFEMVELKFHARMPMFVARQWIRHRTANVNEYSARYSVVKDCYYVPDVDICQGQSNTNKQGSEGQIASPEVARRLIMEMSDEAFHRYCILLQQKDYETTDKRFGDDLAHMGLSRELARMVLPLNYYTEWYWKVDLHNLFHFLSLRADSHAQYEIRAYADAMLEITEKIAPAATASFRNHRMNGMHLSGDEVDFLKSFIDVLQPDNESSSGLSNLLDQAEMSKGRKRELVSKLRRIVGDFDYQP